jgi:uncharacterized delta-60 repeat protein
VYFLEPIEAWESFMIEPLEARVMLSAAALPAMDPDIPFVRDAGRGRVVVAGALADMKSVMVLRLAADGSLDSSFGDGGVLRIVGPSIVDNVIVQPDGKVLLLTDDWTDYMKTTLRRLNADGSLDSSFGDGGVVTLPDGGSDPIALEDSSLALMPDGRIVTAQPLYGRWAPDAPDPNVKTLLAVTRYTADGVLDPTFGDGGTVISGPTDSPLNFSVIASVHVGTDGAVTVTAYPLGQPGGLSARYSADGTPDASWGTDGVAVLELGGALYNWNTLPDGRILAQVDGDWDVRGMSLRRYLPDGQPDLSFGENGVNAFGPVDGRALFDTSPIISNGRTIVPVYDVDVRLLALNPDGTADASFGFLGSLMIERGDMGVAYTSLDAGPGGGIVEAHTTYGVNTDPGGWDLPDQLVVNRFNADGSPVTAFGTNGRVVLDFAPFQEDDQGEPDPGTGGDDAGDDIDGDDDGVPTTMLSGGSNDDGHDVGDDEGAPQGVGGRLGPLDFGRLFAVDEAGAEPGVFDDGRRDQGLLGALVDDVLAL